MTIWKHKKLYIFSTWIYEKLIFSVCEYTKSFKFPVREYTKCLFFSVHEYTKSCNYVIIENVVFRPVKFRFSLITLIYKWFMHIIIYLNLIHEKKVNLFLSVQFIHLFSFYIYLRSFQFLFSMFFSTLINSSLLLLPILYWFHLPFVPDPFSLTFREFLLLFSSLLCVFFLIISPGASFSHSSLGLNYDGLSIFCSCLSLPCRPPPFIRGFGLLW